MAPVHKNVLAPGDSTVVELVFNGKTARVGPKTVNATVSSNDSTAAGMRLSFSARAVADTDTVSTILFSPRLIEFGKGQEKRQIVFENVKDSSNIVISHVGYLMDDVVVKTENESVKMGNGTTVKLEWDGDTPEYDIERSLTFETGSNKVPRISIPYVIKGTKGPKLPAQQHAAKAVSKANQPPPAKTPASRTAVGNAATQKPAHVKADTLKATNPVDQQQWPPK